jgi:hypothetical protein
MQNGRNKRPLVNARGLLFEYWNGIKDFVKQSTCYSLWIILPLTVLLPIRRR